MPEAVKLVSNADPSVNPTIEEAEKLLCEAEVEYKKIQPNDTQAAAEILNRLLSTGTIRISIKQK